MIPIFESGTSLYSYDFVNITKPRDSSTERVELVFRKTVT